VTLFGKNLSRVISSIFSPILWLLIVGGGLGSVVSFDGISYQAFIFPGVLLQAALFTSPKIGVD